MWVGYYSNGMGCRGPGIVLDRLHLKPLLEGHRLHAALPDCLCGIGPFSPGLPCTPTFTTLYFRHLSLVCAPEQL